MRIPDPKANTTTEAYLAYKAGYLEESELKPVLYEPYLHFDAWLAYWAGLTSDYPNKGAGGKNLFDYSIAQQGYLTNGNFIPNVTSMTSDYIEVEPNTSYTASANTTYRYIAFNEFAADKSYIQKTQENTDSITITTTANTKYIRVYYNQNTAVNESTLISTQAQIEKGSTATSYEPYYAEPEMLTDEEALVAYLSGVTDTYPEDIKDPYDVRIVGYLKYLVSVRWGRPEYPVNNEEFYLSTMKPPVVPSGDPSSDIEMDDTAEAPFIDLKMYGDTFQQTYSGWQMLGGQGMATPFSDTSYWGSLTSGLTQTPIEDGWATLSNTSGSSMQFANCFIKTQSQFQASTTYTVVIELANVESPGPIRMAFASPGNTADSVASYNFISCPAGVTEQTDNATWYSETGLVEGEYVLSFTTKSTLVTYLPRLFFMYPSVDKTFDVRMSIIEGDHSSDWQNYIGDNWQPYVGGIPAPNPDYPQAVQTVTGEQTVTVTGKNLFNVTSTTRTATRNGVKITIADDGMITLDGKSTGATWPDIIWSIGSNAVDHSVCKYYFPRVMDNAVFSLKYVSGTASGGSVTIRFNDDAKKEANIPFSSMDTTRTVQDVNGINRAYITQLSTGVTFDNFSFYVQVEEGTKATSLKPYQKQEYEVNLGKNLFDKDNMNVRNAYLYNNQLVIRQNYSDRSFVIQCEPSTTYTISRGKITSSFRVAYSSTSVADIPSTTSEIRRVACGGEIDNDSGSSITITTDSTAKTIIVHYGTTSDSNLEESVASIQIEKGSIATEYAPYFTPIELCKIGDYQDYIYKSGDDWYLHKVTGSLLLTGDEISRVNLGCIQAAKVIIPGETGIAPLSIFDLPYAGINYLTNNFTPTSENVQSPSATIGVFIGNNYANFRIGPDVTSLRDGKDWFNAHNTLLYAKLKTPTDTKITNSELISQLDALMEGGSYEGKTYIKVTATDPNLPGLLYVEAGKYA